jgi:hypothetical protein
MATKNAINSNIPIEISKGGTASTTLTSKGVLIGNTTSALISKVGTNGQVLIGGAAGDGPAFATLTSTLGTITYTPGANSLNLDVTNWVDKTAWTPVLSFGGGTTGIAYTTQDGLYIRINNMVVFYMNILLSSKGSSVGNCSISGLPLSATAINYATSAYFSNLTFTVQVSCGLAASGTSLVLYSSATGGAITALTDTAFANTTNIIITGSYFV